VFLFLFFSILGAFLIKKVILLVLVGYEMAIAYSNPTCACGTINCIKQKHP